MSRWFFFDSLFRAAISSGGILSNGDCGRGSMAGVVYIMRLAGACGFWGLRVVESASVVVERHHCLHHWWTQPASRYLSRHQLKVDWLAGRMCRHLLSHVEGVLCCGFGVRQAHSDSQSSPPVWMWTRGSKRRGADHGDGMTFATALRLTETAETGSWIRTRCFAGVGMVWANKSPLSVMRIQSQYHERLAHQIWFSSSVQVNGACFEFVVLWVARKLHA